MTTFPKDRIVTGTLCYLFDADRVLLLKRTRPPQQGLWSPPGGKLELGESPEECVIREMREETGLTISEPELRAIVTVFDAAWPIHWLLMVFRADIHSGTLIPDSDEGEVRWIRLNDLDAYERPHADRTYWPHIIATESRVWRGKFTYDTPHTLVNEAHYTH